MGLELKQNRDDLIFEKEYNLNTKPLDIDTFYKSLAYACLYKSYGKTVDAIKAEDITISIIREAKPVELFRYFREHACTVTEFCKGIYYIKGNTWFPTQIVVTSELDKAGQEDGRIKVAIMDKSPLK